MSQLHSKGGLGFRDKGRMNHGMRAAQYTLARLLEANELTAGMYVRVYGKHLIAVRVEHIGPNRTQKIPTVFDSPGSTATSMASA